MILYENNTSPPRTCKIGVFVDSAEYLCLSEMYASFAPVRFRSIKVVSSDPRTVYLN